ncbi:hypothetical protein ALC56_10429 [Trachymyrmex septentrionalis]|uniref:Uncharacterized protein n=1 Tax=Trachymyrmex septentrionalis TaxID=34720 RepID=A0A195F5A5_9HYME|nr:hypothetical protein ALC56_10429 [Trachymyrmex septentrionalis]
MYNVERHDGRIDIIPCYPGICGRISGTGAQEYAAGRPGRSVIRRGQRARRRCGSHHNNRPRPLSRRLAEARGPVVTGGEDVEEVESWRRAAAFSRFQSSRNVSPCQFARLTRERDVHLQTNDCELTYFIRKIRNYVRALFSLKPRSSESTPESADRSTTLVIVYKYGLADSPEILNGLSNSCKISI